MTQRTWLITGVSSGFDGDMAEGPLARFKAPRELAAWTDFSA
jgi:hypothetical protein